MRKRPPLTPSDIEAELKKIAALAQPETLSRFRSKPSVDDKACTLAGRRFDPVTEADRQAEKAIRAHIETAFPDHGFIGEETGSSNVDSEYCWIVDPVDGTRSFIAGLPSWGTLVGLLLNGEPIAGMMHQPFTREFFISTGGLAWHEQAGNRHELATSNTNSLDQAILMATAPEMFEHKNLEAFTAVAQNVRLTRYGFDCYAYCMLAAGHIELVIEADLSPYDILPLVPIIENAGGIVTNWRGDRDLSSGRVIAAANVEIHQQAIEIIRFSAKQ